MNRRTMISLAAGLFVFLAGCGTGSAQQSDMDKIKATIDAYHAAISALDINKMDAVWAHDPYVMAIQPGDTTVSVDWDAVRKGWERIFAIWSELKVTQKDGPYIHVNGGIAWADGTASVSGKRKTGDPATDVATFETDVLEKRGDSWLLVSHSAWRAPK